MKAGSRAAGKNLLPLGVKAGRPAEQWGFLLLGPPPGLTPPGEGDCHQALLLVQL